MNKPSREWLEKMADAEDAAGSTSVGGMAADTGQLEDLMHRMRQIKRRREESNAPPIDIDEILECATDVFRNQSTGPETEFERGARQAIEYIKQLIEYRSRK